MEFKSLKEAYIFFNPISNLLEKSEVEIRFDPLTGKPSRIVEKPMPISLNPDISDVGVKPCPFCDEKIVARSNLDKFYWCDVSAISKLLDEAYSNKKPEDVAKYMKKFFT